MPIEKQNQDKIVPSGKGYHDTLYSVMQSKAGIANYTFFADGEKSVTPTPIQTLAKFATSGKNPLETASGIIRAVWFTLHGIDNAQIVVDTATINELNKLLNAGMIEIKKQSTTKAKFNLVDHCEKLPIISASGITYNNENVEKFPLNLAINSVSDSTDFIFTLPNNGYRPSAVIDGYLLKMHLDVFCYFEDRKSISKKPAKQAQPAKVVA